MLYSKRMPCNNILNILGPIWNSRNKRLKQNENGHMYTCDTLTGEVEGLVIMDRKVLWDCELNDILIINSLT